MLVENTAEEYSDDARAVGPASMRPDSLMSDGHSPEQAVPQTLLIVNARVSTGDPRRPWADAALVRAGRIEAVGASAELRKRAPAGAVAIDARGMRLLPDSADSVVAPGQQANLVLVEQTGASRSADASGKSEIVVQIVDGRIVLDRDSSMR